VTGHADVPASHKDAEPALQSFVEFVCSVLEEKRAEDLVWLDVRGVTDLADDFVIATVLNPRQATGIVDACDKEGKRRGVTRLGIEGESGSSWVLMDYGDLIIHLFLPEQRAYYGLEHIWADAKRVR
jgi:ribosome-associated protein